MGGSREQRMSTVVEAAMSQDVIPMIEEDWWADCYVSFEHRLGQCWDTDVRFVSVSPWYLGP